MGKGSSCFIDEAAQSSKAPRSGSEVHSQAWDPSDSARLTDLQPLLCDGWVFGARKLSLGLPPRLSPGCSHTYSGANGWRGLRDGTRLKSHLQAKFLNAELERQYGLSCGKCNFSD